MNRRNFILATLLAPFSRWLPKPTGYPWVHSQGFEHSSLVEWDALHPEYFGDDGYRKPDPLSAEDLQRCRDHMKIFAESQFETTQRDAADFFNNGFS